MIEENVLRVYWREAVSNVVYTLNQMHVKGDTNKTPYELWFGHTPTIKYLKFFGSKCYIKRDEDLGKFDSICDEGIFFGYYTKRKVYRCSNKRLRMIVESSNVKVDEGMERQSRSSRYDSNDQNDSSNKGKQETKFRLFS